MVPCPQGGANASSLKKQRRPVTLMKSGFIICPNKPRLRAADGRDIEDNADVRCYTYAQRVGYPLTVKYYNIWYCLQRG